jgi:hypothetical protein
MALNFHFALIRKLVQNDDMSVRANLYLDDDVYELALAYARGKGIPLSRAANELMRRGQHAPEPADPGRNVLVRNEYGLLVRAKRDNGLVITPEMVKELSEDEFEY